MKTFAKLALVAIVAVSFASCSGDKSSSTTDSTKIDSATTTTTVDSTVKTDTGKMSDTSKMMKDTTKKM
ncbi:hypothetical protein [Mucilaginibacter ginkgonis]|uniref:Coproporphyrinogen III oxidase n=1 Tax=Mucilaginibacter ginkgonis TaxID=2682091 RepID=A0A6I4I0N4_9SPHI|nr:hypothetical protein [Mucilaginibacter ginkgonis]QQL48390.1 hypothetical protein GO620_009300 [Mucilaginibacter ginkgonis]